MACAMVAGRLLDVRERMRANADMAMGEPAELGVWHRIAFAP